jgi:hypothetical protein
MSYLYYESSPWVLPGLMLIVLGLSIELPYRFAGWLSRNKPKLDPINVLQGGLLTLAAFVLGLSFSQASARFDGRRALVVVEANAIGTTWLRADQLDSTQSKLFRQILMDDTAARVTAYGAPNNSALYQRMIERSNRDQDELWTIAGSAFRANQTNVALAQLRQSLNDMIDVSSQQRQALASHVPTAIITLVLTLVTLASLSLGIRFALEGYRPRFMSAIYVLAYVVVISMMVDYDRPNTGLVTVSLTPLTLQLQSMEQFLAKTAPRDD